MDPVPLYHSTAPVLPIFSSAADAVSRSSAESSTSGPTQVFINDTHHLEIMASPVAYQSTPTGNSQQPVPSEAVVQVTIYRDISNAVGRALGTEGIVAIRALGGPAMEMIVIFCFLIAGALCCAFGFAIWGMTPSLARCLHLV